MNCLDIAGDAKVTLCPLSSQFSQDAHDNTQTVKKAYFFFFLFFPVVVLNSSLDTDETL